MADQPKKKRRRKSEAPPDDGQKRLEKKPDGDAKGRHPHRWTEPPEWIKPSPTSQTNPHSIHKHTQKVLKMLIFPLFDTITSTDQQTDPRTNGQSL